MYLLPLLARRQADLPTARVARSLTAAGESPTNSDALPPGSELIAEPLTERRGRAGDVPHVLTPLRVPTAARYALTHLHEPLSIEPSPVERSLIEPGAARA